MGVSQRLFRKEIIEPEVVFVNQEKTIFQYSAGEGATIVCFNFSLPYGIELKEKLKEKGLEPSLFSVNALTPVKWDKIIEDLGHTKKLVVIDDCKSIHCSRDNFLMQVYAV